jgi:hypothetical protein
MNHKTPYNFIDLTGKKFGKWTVLHHIESSPNWLCRCVCGTVRAVGSSQLRRRLTKSCGCYKSVLVRKAHAKKHGSPTFAALFSTYKSGAKRRNLPFTLSQTFFRNITKQNCYYCGSKPSNKYKGSRTYGYYIYNGLDRLNNNKGYVEKNCVPCCCICNRKKQAMSKTKFLNWIKRVYKHSIER